MTELRDVEADLSRFRARVLVMGLVIVLAFSLVAARLVYLQVVRHDDLNAQAESNRTAVVPIVPNRGLILDRNGVVLATTILPTHSSSPPPAYPTWRPPLRPWAIWSKSPRATNGVSKSCVTSPGTSSRCRFAPG